MEGDIFDTLKNEFNIEEEKAEAVSESPKYIEKVEEKLKRKVDRNRWNQGHHDMIFFGRYLCPSRNPKCETCPFPSICRKDKIGR